MSQDDVASRISEATGEEVGQAAVSYWELGKVDMKKVHPRRLRAYAEVLGISTARLAEAVDIPELELFPEMATSPQPRFPGGSPIPPVVPHRVLPLNIPPELQAVIDEYGDLHPQLKQENVQRLMLSPRDLLGPENGPQTEKDWLQHFYYIRDVVMK